jgi:HEAT repeat protein
VEGIPHVTRLLDDRNPQVRLAAVRALGRIGTTASASALIQHVDKKDARIPPQPITMSLVRTGVHAAEPLIAALGAQRVGVRVMAAEVLGVLEVMRASEPLERMLAVDPDVGARIAAAHALGRLGMPGSVPGLIRSLEMNYQTDVLGAACKSIGQIGNPASIRALEWAMGHAEPAVQIAAATAMIPMGEAGIDMLRSIAQQAGPGCHAAREVLTRHAVLAGNDPAEFMEIAGGAR